VAGCRQFLQRLGLWKFTQSTVLGQSADTFRDTLELRNLKARSLALQGVEEPAVIPAEVPHSISMCSSAVHDIFVAMRCMTVVVVVVVVVVLVLVLVVARSECRSHSK